MTDTENRQAMIAHARHCIAKLGVFVNEEHWKSWDDAPIDEIQEKIAELDEQIAEQEEQNRQRDEAIKRDENLKAKLNGLNGSTPPSQDKTKRTMLKTSAIKTGEGLYVKSPLDAIMDPLLNNRDYRLLAFLINQSGKKGYCWWSKENIAKSLPGEKCKSHSSVSTIERGLRSLASNGWIENLSPEESLKRGYDTRDVRGVYAKTNTYVMRLDLRD